MKKTQLIRIITTFFMVVSLLGFLGCSNDDSSTTTATPESGTTYKVSFTVDGTPKSFTGGINGKPALSSYDGTPETTIYAFPASVDFADVSNNSYSDGIIIKDYAGTASGTDTTCDIIYKESGTTYQASSVSVTISSYGAQGAAVTGTAADCNVSDGGTNKNLTNISFTVYNAGAE